MYGRMALGYLMIPHQPKIKDTPEVEQPPLPTPIKVIGITFFEDFGRAVKGGETEIDKRKRDNGFHVDLKALAIEAPSVETAKKIKKIISKDKRLTKAANLSKDPIIKGKYIILKPDLTDRSISEATSDTLAFLKENDLLADIIPLDPIAAAHIGREVVRQNAIRNEEPKTGKPLENIRFGAKPDNSGPALVFV